MLKKFSLNFVDVPNRLPIFRHFSFSFGVCYNIVFWKRSMYVLCIRFVLFIFTKKENRKHSRKYDGLSTRFNSFKSVTTHTNI